MDWLIIMLIGVSAVLFLYYIDRCRAKRRLAEEEEKKLVAAPCKSEVMPDSLAAEHSCIRLEPVDIVAAGETGEAIVANQLAKLPESYVVFHKVWMESSPQRQIDHVVVSNDTIFVIETKNYSSKHALKQSSSGKWIQQNGGHAAANKLPNPFMQVIVYTDILRDNLAKRGLDKLTVQPIVVSIGQLRLENIRSNIPLVKSGELCSYIVNYYTPYWMYNDKKQRLIDFLSGCVERKCPETEQDQTPMAS